MYIVACIGAVLLVLSGILNEKEALDSIHQPTIFLFAGVLTLSEAIKITGAGDVVADWMISLIGNTTNPYLIMAVFFLIPFLLYPDHVESGNTYDFHSTSCIGLYENWD